MSIALLMMIKDEFKSVKNIINAFEPSLLISFKSTLNVSRTNDVGSKYLEATKYKLDFSGETIPIVFNNEGIK